MLFRVLVLGEIKKEYDEAYGKVLDCERKCLLDFTNLRGKIKAIVDHPNFRYMGGLKNIQVHIEVCAYLDEQYRNIESAEGIKAIPTVEWLVLTSSLDRATRSYWFFSGYDDNSHCVRGLDRNYFLFSDTRLVVFHPIIDGEVVNFNHSEIRNLINNYRVGLFNSKAISTYNYAQSITNKLATKNIRRSIVIHNRWTETYIPGENSNEESYSFVHNNNICVRKPSNDILSEGFDEYYVVVF